MKMKWNKSGFRPPLCTYMLNWARRTSWGWWDDWDDTVLQTQDSKFEPWQSEAEHATSRSRRLPTILTFTRGWGRNIFCFFQTAETGNRTPDSGVKGSGANHYPRAPAQFSSYRKCFDSLKEVTNIIRSRYIWRFDAKLLKLLRWWAQSKRVYRSISCQVFNLFYDMQTGVHLSAIGGNTRLD